MKDFMTVAKFTILDMIRKKSFIVSNLIIILFIIIGFNVPNIMNSLNGDSNTLNKSLVVDRGNVYEGSLEVLKNYKDGYEFTIDNSNISDEDIKDKVNNGDYDEAIVISKIDNALQIDYYIEDTTYVYEVPSELQSVFTRIYEELQIQKLDLTSDEYMQLHPVISFDLVKTGSDDVKGSPFAIMIVSIFLFYAIYFCAYQVSGSITTEKTSKIIETLITSTSPKTIVLGKTIGIGIVGLLQLIVEGIVVIISYKLFMPSGYLDEIIDMSTITPFLGFMIILYFILGYAVYALLYALVGSTVSKPEDVQSANGPVAIISVISFYLSYFSMMNPTSSLNKLAALIPTSSPFCMPFRVMMGLASVSEIILSILILIITIILISYISVKIYSQAILNYGNRIVLKDMIKYFNNKNV